MSRLFIELYLDEDVNVLVADLLRGRGFVVLAQMYSQADQGHAGIILATRYPPYELVRRLLRLLNHFTAEEVENRVIYI